MLVLFALTLAGPLAQSGGGVVAAQLGRYGLHKMIKWMEAVRTAGLF